MVCFYAKNSPHHNADARLRPPKFAWKLLMKKLLYLFAFSLFLSSTVQAETVSVLMKTTKGEITLALDSAKAPKTVANFLRYVDESFYNGTLFHRVIPDFMIQGGGLTPDMQRKITHDPVENEADNGLKNLRGTISMARTNNPHSATAQFFINHRDNANLDYAGKHRWGYAVFGKVTKGMDIVDSIATVATTTRDDRRDVPEQPILIESISRL
jgi:cyclophilin family peptidyl-prolyl cis-trans isomerase